MYQCKLCRKTVFYGRRKHVYEKGHRQRLRELLRAFGDKVAAARRMISAASVERYDPPEHDRTFWCHCCEQEVARHTSDGSITVLHGGLMGHIYRPEHKKAVNNFWWTHQADVKLKSQFVLTTEEYERFKTSVTKALEGYEETEDTLIKQMAEHIQMVEQSRQELMQSTLEIDSYFAVIFSICFVFCQSLCTVTVNAVDVFPHRLITLYLIAFSWEEASGQGNIHTGAVPPWMVCDEEEAGKQEIGPTLEGFLKHKEKMALKKLPPNRVGANFDHNAETDAGWLPSFGRVWNSGRRWQSRHQYRKESGAMGAKRKRNEDV
ncbi:LOW QUALITY PROTEIN: centrosomal AT-AC splicing factor [Gastrophryne carolinensis]